MLCSMNSVQCMHHGLTTNYIFVGRPPGTAQVGDPYYSSLVCPLLLAHLESLAGRLGAFIVRGGVHDPQLAHGASPSLSVGR
jgi:hypothetical protein